MYYINQNKTFNFFIINTFKLFLRNKKHFMYEKKIFVTFLFSLVVLVLLNLYKIFYSNLYSKLKMAYSRKFLGKKKTTI